MNRQDRVHRILFGAEHHLQFIGPNGGIEPFQLGPDLFLGLIILLLGDDFRKNPKIFEAVFLLFPFLDRIRQPAFFRRIPLALSGSSRNRCAEIPYPVPGYAILFQGCQRQTPKCSILRARSIRVS